MIEIKNLSFSYKDRKVLNDFSLNIEKDSVFGLLGPNGSGKTTLFKILSTALPIQDGSIQIDSLDANKNVSEIRKKMGVVFQSPSLDDKLKVSENLILHGCLYGIDKKLLDDRITELLEMFQLQDRANDFVHQLSGGLKRRVEIIKALIHKPDILIMDEPSTGLDPAVRIGMWDLIKKLNQKEGLTVLVTTHLMQDADECSQVAVLNEGKIIALGSPSELKAEIDADVILLEAHHQEDLKAKIENKFDIKVDIKGSALSLKHKEGHVFIKNLVEQYEQDIKSVNFHKPNLEDVFLAKTGRDFSEPDMKDKE